MYVTLEGGTKEEKEMTTAHNTAPENDATWSSTIHSRHATTIGEIELASSNAEQ